MGDSHRYQDRSSILLSVLELTVYKLIPHMSDDITCDEVVTLVAAPNHEAVDLFRSEAVKVCATQLSKCKLSNTYRCDFQFSPKRSSSFLWHGSCRQPPRKTTANRNCKPELLQVLHNVLAAVELSVK